MAFSKGEEEGGISLEYRLRYDCPIALRATFTILCWPFRMYLSSLPSRPRNPGR